MSTSTSVSRIRTDARALLAILLVATLVAACGGGGGGGGGSLAPSSYTIGGSVSGLTGTSGLVLQNNGGDNLTVPANATSFTFTTALAAGAAYSVKVLTPPTSPSQTCTVSAGSGAVAAANVTSVSIACTTATFSVGGSIIGLTSGGLVLQDNGGANLSVPANASSFTFAAAVASGAPYSVKVFTQPPNPSQTCTVSGGSGTVGAANVTSVSIACVKNTFSVGGSISGLTSGGMVLQDNAGDNLTVAANATSFTFATALAPGAPYSVSVLTQPTQPAQRCKVSNGAGSIANGNVTTVALTCRGVGKFLYVVNQTDGPPGDVSGFVIGSSNGTSNGTLTAMAGAPVAADLKPAAIAVDASGNFVYVSNSKSGDVSVYASDPAAGTLTLQGQTSSAGTSGTSIAISPSDQYVFVGGYGNPATNTTLFGFALDSSSGVLTADPHSPYPASNTPFGMAVDPTGQFLFVSAIEKQALHVYTIGTPATMLLTEVASSPATTGSSPYGVAVSPLGTTAGGVVFVAESGANRVGAFAYDNLGNLTELTKYGSPWPSGLGPDGLAVDPAGKYLYVANYLDGSVASFAIGPKGQLTSIATGNSAVSTGNLSSVANPGPIDVKVDPTGAYVYVANYLDGSVSVFSASAGTLTLMQTYPTGSGPVPTGSGPVALAID